MTTLSTPRSLVVVAGVLLLPALAAAQPAVDEARRHADAGQAALEANDFQRALGEYNEAYRLFPNVLLLVNVARAESGLGRNSAAIVTLKRVLDDAALDAARRREVEAEVQRLHGLVAELTVSVSHEGAQVVVNGRPVGTSPLAEPVLVDPGAMVVEATREGLEPARWVAPVAAGEQRTITLTLRAPRTESGGEGEGEVGGDGHDVAPPPPPPAAGNARPTGLLWATGLGAGALGVGSLVIGGYLASIHCGGVGEDCPSRHDGDLNALGWVATGMGAVAIAGGVIFIYLLATTGDAEEAAETALAEPGVVRF